MDKDQLMHRYEDLQCGLSCHTLRTPGRGQPITIWMAAASGDLPQLEIFLLNLRMVHVCSDLSMVNLLVNTAQ
jgi:hypothetical protein